MRIMHLAAHLGGGAGKAIAGMALQQYERDYVFLVLLDNPSNMNYVNALKKHGVAVYICPYFKDLALLLQEADIVIVNWWCHPLMVEFLHKFPQIPCRLILWNHINGCTYPYLPFDFLDCFSGIAFTSGFSYDNVLWSRVEKHKIWNKSKLILGMGNFKPCEYEPKDDYTNKEKFIVGYVGTINYGKMASDFFAYCEAAAERIPNIEFCLVGEPNEGVKADAMHSRISDKIMFTGLVANVASYYLSFDVLGYLLNQDSYATTENVLLEAMAFGLPIIVKNNNVENRIIKDGINGYIIRSAEEYAEELAYLWEHPEEREWIGESAYRHVASFYSTTDNYQKFRRMMEEVLKRDKEIYSFAKLLGEKPLDWFLFFANKDGYIFKEYIEKKNKYTLERIKQCKPIFKEKAKSSVNHFSMYFPYDEYLQDINEAIHS